MSTVVLVQAQPRLAATGAIVDVRLAGGGTKPYTQLGFSDWRGGIANLPRFTSALGFDQSGWTGGALPQTGGIRFFPSDKALLSALSNMNWIGARIVVSVGDDEAIAPAYPTQLVGEVASSKVDGGALTLTISDLSADLDKPVAPDTFAGTGGLEGGDDATGRVKRRTWGYAFNIEGRLLDKAYSIYEFGDPNRPLSAFPMVKDKGREAGSYVDVAWQGSAAATLTTLRNTNAPTGGCVRAPSIAAVKWWTTPAGPLTADVKGEVGPGYVETAPSIAARVVSVYSALIAVGNTAEANGWQSASVGVHVDQSGETVGNLLDRLLLPVSLVWTLGGDGILSFRRFNWTGPVETLLADTIDREVTFKPLKTRRIGFQRNHRQHSDAEISATLLLATDATYADGTPIETLKPTDPGATAGATWTSNVSNRPTNLAELAGAEGIKNGLVAIGANGTLSGAGGGQVTIGGLGFGGDLDAQRNSRITISTGGAIFGIGTADRYVDNFQVGVQGLYLANGYGTQTIPIANAGVSISSSGALTGGGGGQVTIGGLGYRGDLRATSGTNLIGESLRLGRAYILAFGNAAVTFNRDGTSNSPNRINNNAAHAPGTNGIIWGDEIYVTPGERIYTSCEIGQDNVDGEYYTFVYYYSGAGSMTGSDIVPGTLVNNSIVPNGQWRTTNGTFIVPPNTAYILIGGSRTGGSAGTWYCANPYVGRQSPGADVTTAQPVVSWLSPTTGRAKDTRLLNTSNAFGLRSLSSPPGFSASVSSETATITLDGNGVYYTDWAATISLPSASFPGLAVSTMYYFWRNMPVDGAGDSYGYSTDLTQALGTGKSYFGNYTTPSAGGGGGGGGYYGGENCVAADAFVPTANRGTIRAHEVEEGDLLYVLSESLGRVVRAPCTGNRPGRNDCCRMLGQHGAQLTLAINTPITLRDGSWIVAANAWGRDVGHLLGPDDEAPAWLTLLDVEGIGELEVARISCGDGTYAAGDDIEGPFLFSHNVQARTQKP